MSVVEDAMTAITVGVRQNGVTAMHDATECGVWGGLYEIARASCTGMAVDRDAIPLAPAAARLCARFGIDPYAAISEGTLIITAGPDSVPAILARLAAKGIAAAVIGEVTEKARGIKVTESGRQRELAHPVTDPFWPAFAAAMEREKASGI
ncbi:MAG: AIR synthase, partial [Elusimicrobia bacterium]|nr:AIR synthase [Elusimicrobiota bacterium]